MSNEQENEQEFDAESMAALARSSIAAPPPAKSVPPTNGVKDDSGLINLKALAAQTATDGEVAPDKPSAPNGKSIASAAESARPAARSSSRPGASSDVSAAANVPAVVAAPPAPAAARSNALIYVLGAVAIAAIAAWIYVNRTRVPAEPTSEPMAEVDETASPNDEPAAVGQPSGGQPSEPEPTRVAENTPPPVEPTTPTSPDPSATAPTDPAAAAPTDGRDRDERERDRDRDRERERERAAAAAAGGAAASPTATTATPAPTTPAPTAPATTPARSETPPAGQAAATKRGSSVDELLDRALGGGPSAGGVGTREQPREREAAPTADLPDVPPRSAITSALGRLRRSVENCANGQVGVARAEVTFGSDGNVSSVNISGAPFAGTPQGTCMERVVRRARVPRFRRASLTITYPYSVRPPEP